MPIGHNKALIPVRIGLSMYLAPAFSRGFVEPVRSRILGIWRRWPWYTHQYMSYLVLIALIVRQELYFTPTVQLILRLSFLKLPTTDARSSSCTGGWGWHVETRRYSGHKATWWWGGISTWSDGCDAIKNQCSRLCLGTGHDTLFVNDKLYWQTNHSTLLPILDETRTIKKLWIGPFQLSMRAWSKITYHEEGTKQLQEGP